MNRAAILQRLKEADSLDDVRDLVNELESAPKTLSERIAAYFAERRKRAYNRAEDRRVEMMLKQEAALKDKAASEMKLVGTFGVPVAFFGRDAGKEYVYFYENAKGERKAKATDDQLLNEPAVVYFLAGKPIDAIVTMVDKKSIAA